MDSWLLIVIIIIVVLVMVWAVSSYSKKQRQQHSHHQHRQQHRQAEQPHMHSVYIAADSGRNSSAAAAAAGDMQIGLNEAADMDANIDAFYSSVSADSTPDIGSNHDADISQMRFELEQEFQEILPN